MPDHRFVIYLHAGFDVADGVRLVAVRRCGWAGVLSARFTFVPRPIQSTPHVRTFYIYGGRGFGFFIVILGPSCRCPLRTVDPANLVELRACTHVQVSVGSSTVVASPAAHYCQVGSLPPYLLLFRVFDWVMFAVVRVLLGSCTHFPFFLRT